MWTTQFKISILLKYKTNLKSKGRCFLKIFLLFSSSILTPQLHGRILKRHPETSRAFQGRTVPWSRLTPRKSPKPSHGYLSPSAAEFSVCNALPGSHRLGCFSPYPKRLPLAPLSAQGPRIFPSLTVSRPSSALTMSTPRFHRPKPIVSSPRPAFTVSATPSHHL